MHLLPEPRTAGLQRKCPESVADPGCRKPTTGSAGCCARASAPCQLGSGCRIPNLRGSVSRPKSNSSYSTMLIALFGIMHDGEIERSIYRRLELTAGWLA